MSDGDSNERLGWNERLGQALRSLPDVAPDRELFEELRPQLADRARRHSQTRRRWLIAAVVATVAVGLGWLLATLPVEGPADSTPTASSVARASVAGQLELIELALEETRAAARAGRSPYLQEHLARLTRQKERIERAALRWTNAP